VNRGEGYAPIAGWLRRRFVKDRPCAERTGQEMNRPRFRSGITEWAWVVVVLAGFGFVAWLILAAVATAFLD
jgi:hypothetical protein